MLTVSLVGILEEIEWKLHLKPWRRVRDCCFSRTPFLHLLFAMSRLKFFVSRITSKFRSTVWSATLTSIYYIYGVYLSPTAAPLPPRQRKKKKELRPLLFLIPMQLRHFHITLFFFLFTITSHRKAYIFLNRLGSRFSLSP